MSFRLFFLLPATTLLCVLLSACDRDAKHSASTAPSAGAPQSSDERMTVIATVYPLADVVRQIGGRWVKAEWVLERGQTLESFTPSDELRARLNVADLVITGGSADESWAAEGYENAYRGARLLRLDSLSSAQRAARSAQRAGAEGDAPLGALWLDPIVMREAAEAIASRLATLRPSGEQDFRRNAAALQQQIDHICDEFAPRLTPVAKRRAMVLSPLYNALLERYGIAAVQIVHQPSPLRLSDSDIMRLRAAIKDSAGRLNTLLLEADTPPAVANELAARLRVQVLLLNSLGTSSDIGPTTYQDLLRYNLEALTKVK